MLQFAFYIIIRNIKHTVIIEAYSRIIILDINTVISKIAVASSDICRSGSDFKCFFYALKKLFRIAENFIAFSHFKTWSGVHRIIFDCLFENPYRFFRLFHFNKDISVKGKISAEIKRSSFILLFRLIKFYEKVFVKTVSE